LADQEAWDQEAEAEWWEHEAEAELEWWAEAPFMHGGKGDVGIGAAPVGWGGKGDVGIGAAPVGWAGGLPPQPFPPPPWAGGHALPPGPVMGGGMGAGKGDGWAPGLEHGGGMAAGAMGPGMLGMAAGVGAGMAAGAMGPGLPGMAGGGAMGGGLEAGMGAGMPDMCGTGLPTFGMAQQGWLLPEPTAGQGQTGPAPHGDLGAPFIHPPAFNAAELAAMGEVCTTAMTSTLIEEWMSTPTWLKNCHTHFEFGL
jgi:hypothetical protein